MRIDAHSLQTGTTSHTLSIIDALLQSPMREFFAMLFSVFAGRDFSKRVYRGRDSGDFFCGSVCAFEADMLRRFFRRRIILTALLLLNPLLFLRLRQP